MATEADQGAILRLWRESKGMSLEQAAFAVEAVARSRGIAAKSKKIPRTHASLSRWETGVVDVKDQGLELLAEVYGVAKEDLRKPPPAPGEPPKRTVEVPADQAAAVEAFLEVMRQGR
jgi:transcriptional regulator with XRE-family HTH domain